MGVSKVFNKWIFVVKKIFFCILKIRNFNGVFIINELGIIVKLVFKIGMKCWCNLFLLVNLSYIVFYFIGG